MRRVAAAALALVVLGGCKVDVSVDLSARRDGSGEVQVVAILDREAVDEVGDLRSRLRTDDLERAGWAVEAPQPVEGGGTSLRIRHEFASPAEAEQILSELAGGASGSPLRELTLQQDRGLFRTTTSFRGTVDLRQGIEAFSDARLTESFGGQPLGVPVDALERRLGSTFGRIFGLQVAVRLPGSIESNAPTSADSGAVWAPRLGERVELSATAAQWHLGNIVVLGVGIASAIALIAVLLVRRFSS